MTPIIRHADLVRALATATGLTQSKADEVVDVLGLLVAEGLSEGATVRLPKLGTLRVRQTPAKSGTLAGKRWTKPAGRRVAFSAGTALQRALEVTV